MRRRPPRSTLSSSSAASDVYKRQVVTGVRPCVVSLSLAMQTFILIVPQHCLALPTPFLRLIELSGKGLCYLIHPRLVCLIPPGPRLYPSCDISCSVSFILFINNTSSLHRVHPQW